MSVCLCVFARVLFIAPSSELPLCVFTFPQCVTHTARTGRVVADTVPVLTTELRTASQRVHTAVVTPVTAKTTTRVAVIVQSTVAIVTETRFTHFVT